MITLTDFSLTIYARKTIIVIIFGENTTEVLSTEEDQFNRHYHYNDNTLMGNCLLQYTTLYAASPKFYYQNRIFFQNNRIVRSA